MSTPARKRLMRDFKRLQQDPPAGISGAPLDNNIMLWNAVIFGYPIKNPIMCLVVNGFHADVAHFCFGWVFCCSPDDTPWDGGEFFFH